MSTEPEQSDEDDMTSQDDVRWVYLGSVLAFILTFSLVVLVIAAAAGVLTLSAISQPWFALYSLSVLTAVGWVFGKELVKQWKG